MRCPSILPGGRLILSKAIVIIMAYIMVFTSKIWEVLIMLLI